MCPDKLSTLAKEMSILDEAQDITTARGKAMAGKYLWKKFDVANLALREAQTENIDMKIMGQDVCESDLNLIIENASFRALIHLGQCRV